MARTGMIDLSRLAGDFADRDRPGRTEADVQSGIATLLLAGGLNLDHSDITQAGPSLEAPSGTGRIDIEIGSAVIEVKRNLRVGNVRVEAIDQLAGYVSQRAANVARRYVGVLTDGADWELHHLVDGRLELVAAITVNPDAPDVDGLLTWLEGVLATGSKILPTQAEIERRLGATSPAHALDVAELTALYAKHRDDPDVGLKRELWGRLLTTALGTNFEDSDDLFVNHTLLALTAEAVAHAVLGYDLTDPQLAPATICSGRLFADAQIGNVVETDFFDWPVETAAG